ncbi:MULTISPECIES: DUF397 domain-containing protein [Streptomyces]|uniref:DUF397 domain-containing protein n=1 Tax=Streptomyces TaxID=1883 RepID=UPI000D528774|nr:MULTISPECIES: DUF397 domain-containing protein [Streptomyces]AWE50741.1 DUF397 domain-containing protein [Streptomyces nigra]MCF2535210.1 DUF397 domain-containing protein [Streptomyces sp. FB2]
MKRDEYRIPDASVLTSWRKSSYSGGDSGDCLEVADAPHPTVPVRDSKHPTGPALLFSAPAWTAFVGAVYRGRM